MKVSKVSKSIRLGVTVRSPEPYHDAVVESVEEFLETVSPEDWKKDARQANAAAIDQELHAKRSRRRLERLL